MSSKRRHTKAEVWSVEPKAPSLVSLSVRDQNIPRPPKRSSSLKQAASSLKKGLSHHNLLHTASDQNRIHTLRRGGHQSCSSLQVNKTRAPRSRPLLSVIDSSKSKESSRAPSDAGSSDGTLLDVVEHYWDGLSRLPAIHKLSRRSRETSAANTHNNSTETVLRSEVAGRSRTSSALSHSTYHTASGSHQNSARRLVSRVFSSKHKQGLQSSPAIERVEAWVDDAKSVPNLPSNELESFPAMPEAQEHEYQPADVSELNKSFAQSPQNIECRSLSPPRSPADQQRGTTSRANNHAQGLGLPLRLRITAEAEITETTLTSEDSIWAVAQIHAEAPSPPAAFSRSLYSVAVAIVLDNSRLATRKDVKKACLEIITLATNLQENVDHIGVYCTSGSNLADTCLLSVADPLNIDTLRSRLDKVQQRSRDCFRVEDAFLQAAQALRTMRSQEPLRPQLKEDIVVITSSAFGLNSCFDQNIEDLCVHLLNPSLIPYSSKVRNQLVAMRGSQLAHVRGVTSASILAEPATTSGANGWLLDSSRCLSDDCDKHGSHTLTDIILHSKAQLDAGTITNVAIDIRGRNDATIEAVVGDEHHTTLLPGQMISIAVRVKLNSLERCLSLHHDSMNDSPSDLSVLDAISELELALGKHLSELFEISATYSHSFFPGNTRLEVRESCWLPRILPPRGPNTQRDLCTADFGARKYNTRVQKQFALCIAASCPPAEAIRQIDARLPSHRLTDGVVNFLEALKRRLRHRFALFADVTFMDYLLSSEGLDMPSPTSIRHASHNSSFDDLRVAPEQRVEHGGDTPRTIVRRKASPLHCTSTEVDEGEARRIWQHIRRTSRREQQPRMSQDSCIEAHDEVQQHELDLEQIRETARRHGRKISSATLRSLAKDFKRFDPGFTDELRDDVGTHS